MSAPVEFGEVCQDFRGAREVMGRLIAGVRDSGVKGQLNELVASLDKNFAELETAYPKAQSQLTARRDEIAAKLQQQQKEIVAAKEKIAAAKEAALAAAAAMPAAKPVELKLGAQLRDELLARFGKRNQPGVGVVLPREIWEDWDVQQREWI